MDRNPKHRRKNRAFHLETLERRELMTATPLAAGVALHSDQVAVISSLASTGASAAIPAVAMNAVAASGTDLDVTYIGRTPRYDYDAAKNNPAPGDAVTFEAHVHNWGSGAVSSAAYRWEIDGATVAQGTLSNLSAQEERVVSLPWMWRAGDHNVRFTIDPQNLVAETSEANNSIEDRINGISVGFWVEQSVYDYFQAHQQELGIGSNSWEDWAQRQMARWNQYSAEAIYELSPLGVLDRVRIDKIIVVPDGSLPPGNIPAFDKTVDLIWPFSDGLLTSGFYADTTTKSDANPFYFEGSLIHELGHARYLIDQYSFDVANTADYASVQILEQGQPVAGSPLMPFLAWGEVLYYNREGGVMSGPYHGWSPYEAAALNRIAGQRASQGNYNAPGNIGVFLNDLPTTNRLRIITESGTSAAGANVKVFQSAPHAGLYGKTFDSTADAEYTTDANGEIVLPRNPFFNGAGPTTIWEPPMLVLRIEYAGKVWFQFVEVTEFNLEYWRGHTTEGQYVLELPGPGNTREDMDIGLESHDRPITRGSTSPSAASGTDFGSAYVNKPHDPSLFVINNEGARTLSLTSSQRVTLSGPAAADFVVTAQPEAEVLPGSLTTFRVQFNPTKAGMRTATLTIESNDPDEPSFSFSVQGQGLADNGLPSVAIVGPAKGVRGQSIAFSLTTTDPNAADAAAGFSYTIDWGDGQLQNVARSAGNGTQTIKHTYAATGNYIVKASATDQQNGAGAPATSSVQILAAALLPDVGDPGKLSLYVGGTTKNDRIRIVVAKKAKLEVFINDHSEGTFSPNAQIYVYGQAGNDDIQLSENIKLNALLDGGAGNDKLRGARGNDILLGGAGKDSLFGRWGKDLSIGGLDEDWIYGNGDQDLLIGGPTAFDANETALLSILAEWTSGRSYGQRMKNLTGSGSGTRANGSNFLVSDGANATIIDDRVVDHLDGGKGKDWFFDTLSGKPRDRVTQLEYNKFEKDAR